ncbi:hypothetical protein [Marinobacter xestospongiae]|uniref:hypothetical protein n=1 Tax=Marinobacter xestospongiae TaxID=994319 RepID=UPI0020063088|nr:hypothetical protein [Marinobacter xestospongiae]MCK7565280.1 hypothetical protein [Marinobacter xestospongiae]
MKHKLIFRRTLNVQCWRVSGQVAIAKKRSDLLPVLLRVQEVEQTDPKDIADHLFFERDSRRVVAERLLKVAHNYGLLKKENDGAYSLSEEGKRAIAKERVYVPQEGTWTIWASDDSMLEYPILHVVAWEEPSAFDEVWGKDKKENSNRAFKTLPPWVTKGVGRVFDAMGKAAESSRIDKMHSIAESVPDQASLELKWDVGTGDLRLRGDLAGQSVDSVLKAPDIEPDQVWKSLLKQAALWSRWDGDRKALKVTFSESEISERERLTRDLTFKNPMIPGVGQFKDIDVQNIPLFPLLAGDAEKWADWRLKARINDYATNPRYQQWVKEAAEPFSEFSPALRERAELAEVAWADRGNRPTAYCWHLVASEDWGL